MPEVSRCLRHVCRCLSANTKNSLRNFTLRHAARSAVSRLGRSDTNPSKRDAARRPVALATLDDERDAQAQVHGAGMTATIECRYYGRDFTTDEVALLRALIAAEPQPTRAAAHPSRPAQRVLPAHRLAQARWRAQGHDGPRHHALAATPPKRLEAHSQSMKSPTPSPGKRRITDKPVARVVACSADHAAVRPPVEPHPEERLPPQLRFGATRPVHFPKPAGLVPVRDCRPFPLYGRVFGVQDAQTRHLQLPALCPRYDESRFVDEAVKTIIRRAAEFTHDPNAPVIPPHVAGSAPALARLINISDILGHRQIEMTACYAVRARDEVRNTAERVAVGTGEYVL